MPRTTPVERIRRAHAACTPISETGGSLLNRYLALVDLDRPGPTAENETVFFYELCRLVEQVDLSELSLPKLDSWMNQRGVSRTCRIRRRLIVGRLLRILEADGFPDARDRRAQGRIDDVLRSVNGHHGVQLRRWVDDRRRAGVGWYELSHEVRRLASLEAIACAAPDGATTDELVRGWLSSLVQPVVNCKCPPITRYPDPTRCTSCGETIDESSRPSPSPRKQRELAALARRYLGARHQECHR